MDEPEVAAVTRASTQSQKPDGFRIEPDAPATQSQIAIKSALGKLRVPDDLPDHLDAFAFERLSVSDLHSWAVRTLPPLHDDPFDRLLAAQAVCERATNVSADTIFDGYGLTRIW